MEKDLAQSLYESGSVELKFEGYYKYSFTFSGENEFCKVSVTYGGNSEDIYRYTVGNNAFDAPKTFDELMQNYYSVVIEEKSTGKKFEDYHF